MTTTERARMAEKRHSNASKAWTIANEKASKIGPRFLQTEETLSAYEAAQADLEVADREFTDAQLALAEIPSEEL